MCTGYARIIARGLRPGLLLLHLKPARAQWNCDDERCHRGGTLRTRDEFLPAQLIRGARDACACAGARSEALGTRFARPNHLRASLHTRNNAPFLGLTSGSTAKRRVRGVTCLLPRPCACRIPTRPRAPSPAARLRSYAGLECPRQTTEPRVPRSLLSPLRDSLWLRPGSGS
jgi:hypothetical protein